MPKNLHLQSAALEQTAALAKILAQMPDDLPTLSATQHRQLFEYMQLLIKWTGVYNLTAITQPDKIYTHHLLDCLAILPILQSLEIIGTATTTTITTTTTVLDVGSGAGLPGLLWALLLPELTVYSVDAVHKKIAFQTQVKDALEMPNFFPCHQRVEQLNQPVDFITARAYSDIPKLLQDTKHLRSHQHPKAGYILLKAQLTDDILAAQKLYPSMQILPIDIPKLAEQRHLIYLPFTAIDSKLS